MALGKTLGIILKTVERCNIDCKYCYMFNMNDKTYLDRSPYIHLDTIKQTAVFLSEGIDTLNISAISIGFHGGEPLMQKKHVFETCCSIFKKYLADRVDLKFTLQTNGMLIDNEWIDIFNKHRVCLGISIDGPKEYHDQDRVDHLGRGTYDRVAEKIHYLNNSHYFKNETTGAGLLCVINPLHSARKIYRHFVDDLSSCFMDFLLPYNTHMHEVLFSAEAYGDYLCELFREWVTDDNPKIQIRRFSSLLGLFYGAVPEVYGVGYVPEDELPLISISSMGDLSPSDEFRATDTSVNYSGSSVFNSSLKDYLEYPIFHQIQQATVSLPSTCKKCCWQKPCAGGTVVNRYHKENLFDNPSIYCHGLQNFYAEVVRYLLEHGYNYDKLTQYLGFERMAEWIQ